MTSSFFLSLFLRDIMNRSGSDSSLHSSLPLSHSESPRAYGSKTLLLSSKPFAQQGYSSNGGRPRVSGVDGPFMMSCGNLEKSSSLGELRGSPALATSYSTRSLCTSSPDPDMLGSTPGKGSSQIPQNPIKKNLLEEDNSSTGEETDSASGRKKHPFNKIFKKRK